jgi:hypothetical protein
MTHEQLLHEHGRLVDLLFVRGHLTGSEKRRLQRVRRKLDRWEQKTTPRARESRSVPVSESSIEPFFRLELCNDDGTLFESVEAQTKEQAEEAFFAAVGMLLRYSKQEEQKK